MRKHLPILLAAAAVLAACSSTTDDPGFGSGSNSDDPSGASAEDAAGGRSNDATHDDAATTPGHDSGRSQSDDATEVDARETDAARSSDAQASPDGSGFADASTADGETGPLVGMTAAHNAVRAMVSTKPALPPMIWSDTLAAYAQAWATRLAAHPTTCAAPVHRDEKTMLAPLDYGENLAEFGRKGAGVVPSTAQQAVDGWAAEVSCWTYGTIEGTETCNATCAKNLSSDGCGHYTQVVWRTSIEVGCGVASCVSNGFTEDIWVCNYAPAGNIPGKAPY